MLLGAKLQNVSGRKSPLYSAFIHGVGTTIAAVSLRFKATHA
jgi:hypothetical protein